ERGFRGDVETEALTPATDVRRHGQGGEEAENHGWNARQDLEDRLRPGAKAGCRVLREVDRREEAERPGDKNGDERDEQCARQQRNETERRPDLALVGAERRLRIPFRAEEEFGDGRSALERGVEEKAVRFPDDREDNAD